ncbi:hypothetical protein HY450_03130 [Candidatus Pacearchaeota archaeon]|nr:hypothetical protein [Candidatus Pacearchaeota archaeon]
MGMQTKSLLKSVSSEKELSDLLFGDIVKVSIGEQVRKMLFAGEHYGYSFIEQGGSQDIIRHSQEIKYLQFDDTLPQNRGIGVVIFDSFHEKNFHYVESAKEYESFRKMLEDANLWRKKE